MYLCNDTAAKGARSTHHVRLNSMLVVKAVLSDALAGGATGREKPQRTSLGGAACVRSVMLTTTPNELAPEPSSAWYRAGRVTLEATTMVPVMWVWARKGSAR
jgi:hypothetical protein